MRKRMNAPQPAARDIDTSKEDNIRMKRLENAAKAQTLNEWKESYRSTTYGLADVTQQLVWYALSSSTILNVSRLTILLQCNMS
jgi:hypothetical protein